MSEFDNSSNPFAPPLSKVEDLSPTSGELAGRGTRFVAFLIDVITLWVVFVVVGVVGVATLFDKTSSGFFGILLTYAVVFVAFTVMQCVLLYRRSQTLGKLAMKIRIVRSDGSRVGFGRLLGMRMLPMWLIGFIPLVGPLICLLDGLMIFRDSHRCLHDDIADTIVVRA